MTQYGRAGAEGHPGKPGEEGKETGEGGRGGKGGEGGTGARGPAGARARLRWAPSVGYILLAVVLGFLIWRTTDLTYDNRRLIAQVATLNQTQAEQDYRECVARNIRATESVKAFQRLVVAHKKDGNPAAAQAWQSYLDATQQVPLPPCTKPVPGLAPP
jgi:hypothetical protein